MSMYCWPSSDNPLDIFLSLSMSVEENTLSSSTSSPLPTALLGVGGERLVNLTVSPFEAISCTKKSEYLKNQRVAHCELFCLAIIIIQVTTLDFVARVTFASG